MCTEAWRGLISAGPASRQGGNSGRSVAAGISGRSLHWAGRLTGSGDGEKAEVRITPRQRSRWPGRGH